MLTLVAGRVDGPPERPQILPLARLDVELYRGKRNVGRLVRLRDLLPGRYALGVTGRGPQGATLRSGAYVIRIGARPSTHVAAPDLLRTNPPAASLRPGNGGGTQWSAHDRQGGRGRR